ncbi:hypothetical protein [Muricoccus vinaceus]|uniref:Uncharacterized protein n=1 Tax=Muricoccus vinaceus TaxID=424704 RepID=A0ABV6IZN1_9PROT
MPLQNGKQQFLTEKKYQLSQRQIAAFRQRLIDENASVLVANPQLADVLNGMVNNMLGALEAEADAAAPPDNGLAGLIGIGPDAGTDLGQARVTPSVKPYDEQMTAERGSAMADFYYVHQAGEMAGTFRAVMTLQELFKGGVVRLSDGPGAYRLYQFDRKQVLRYTQQERLQAYLRAFGYRAPVHGMPPGATVPPARWASPNTEFHGLFNAFVAEVARFFRDKRISEVVRDRANDPSFGSIATVRRAGLDLRYNLKNFSYGHLSVLRVETLQLLEEAFEILQAEDVRALFGAETAWDVVEDVLRRYHKEQINVSPRSRMAVAGRDILRWLSQPFILTATRAQFEALAQDIADAAEEWLASAQTVGVAVAVPDAVRGAGGPRGTRALTAG